MINTLGKTLIKVTNLNYNATTLQADYSAHVYLASHKPGEINLNVKKRRTNPVCNSQGEQFYFFFCLFPPLSCSIRADSDFSGGGGFHSTKMIVMMMVPTTVILAEGNKQRQKQQILIS